MEPVVEVKNLSASYEGNVAVENISFTVTAGQLVGIIGPNGAGKTTLLKAMTGLMKADNGSIKINGRSVAKARQKIAYVPQRGTIDFTFPVLVKDVVMMGRFPHISWWGFPAARDHRIVEESLQQVEMNQYRRRQIGQLSCGQQQRVFLARALAQVADLFFLDEPFAGIDLASENMIMEILKDLRDRGKTLFVVHHDLSKAEYYFDSLILLNNKLIACGSRDEVFRLDNICRAYEGKAAAFSDNGVVVNS